MKSLIQKYWLLLSRRETNILRESVFLVKKFAIILILVPSLCFAQSNLVPNWSFEDTVQCPGYTTQINYAELWYSPTPNTPDYYNSCSELFGVPDNGPGHQYAKDGNAYIGIFCWNSSWQNDREYVQVELIDSLIENHIYCVGMWVNLTDHVQYAVDRIGLHLSSDPISNTVPSFLPYQPQAENPAWNFLIDTFNWVLISDTFQSQGGEKYITIGNFRNDSTTGKLFYNDSFGATPISYYLVDAVFVYECDSTKTANAGADQYICKDRSIRIGGPALTGCKYHWSPAEGLDNDTVPIPTASLQQTTTYVLEMSDPFYQLTYDTVTVFVDDYCIPNQVYVPNVFSPNGDGTNDHLMVRGLHFTHVMFTIYDRWGNEVFRSENPDLGWDGTYKNKDCPEGVYFYSAEITFDDGESIVKKGSITLVR